MSVHPKADRLRPAVRRRILQFGGPSILLAAFVIVALLYRFAPQLEVALLQAWGLDPWNFPFLDLHALLSALQCSREGIDVMRVNPCDILGRPHIYSPLWLAPAALLPVDGRWLMPGGLVLDTLFILSLYRLPKAERPSETAILALAMLSPATGYALERANNDLIIFLLVIAMVPFAAAPWPRRLVSYAIILIAGLLKYYPLAMLILALREAPKRFIALAVTAVLAIAGFYIFYRHALAENVITIAALNPSRFADIIDFRNLPFGLAALLPSSEGQASRFWPGPETIAYLILAILLLSLIASAWQISLDRELGGRIGTLSAEHIILFVAGAVMITGCFFAGRSVLYRAIFFLLAIPGLLALARAATGASSRHWLRQGLVLIVFLMWSEFFRRGIHALTLLLLPQGSPWIGYPEALFWAFKELVWWRVMALFCGLLLGLFAESPSASPVLRRLHKVRPAPIP